MAIPDHVTTIRFPSDREFAGFRAFIQQNYRPAEAKVERHQVRADGSTLATLATVNFGQADHDYLAFYAVRVHAGVIL